MLLTSERFFAAVIQRRGSDTGQRQTQALKARVALAGGESFFDDGHVFLAARGDGNPGSPSMARYAALVAVGMVRLDTPAILASELTDAVRGTRPMSDLELVLRLISEHGADAVCRLVGDLAILLINRETRNIIAIRDALGIKSLYYRVDHGCISVSSHANLLSDGQYDRSALTTFLGGDLVSIRKTVHENVNRVPSGHLLKWQDGQTEITRYWSPLQLPSVRERGSSLVERFADLFASAVSSSLNTPFQIWAELSGGTDSSSIVAMASHLSSKGQSARLAGTITAYDDLGDDREQPFVDAVLEGKMLHNVGVRSFWPWYDDGESAPLTDEPSTHYPFFARERAMYRAMQSAGARVLLSGHGADQYLTGTYHYVADLVQSLQLRRALRESVAIAWAHHHSMWRVGFYCGLMPLLPRFAQALIVSPVDGPPRWLRAPWRELYRAQIANQLSDEKLPEGKLTHFQKRRLREIQTLPNWNVRRIYQVGLEVRYPFLFRPLIEFALGLPPEAIARPGASKHILREAMRGVLPEKVRTRTTKGSADSRFAWALEHEGRRIRELLREPILADLGLIEPRLLRSAVRAAAGGDVRNAPHLLSTLALETWLAAHAGRWKVDTNSAAGFLSHPANAGFAGDSACIPTKGGEHNGRRYQAVHGSEETVSGANGS